MGPLSHTPEPLAGWGAKAPRRLWATKGGGEGDAQGRRGDVGREVGP